MDHPTTPLSIDENGASNFPLDCSVTQEFRAAPLLEKTPSRILECSSAVPVEASSIDGIDSDDGYSTSEGSAGNVAAEVKMSRQVEKRPSTKRATHTPSPLSRGLSEVQLQEEAAGASASIHNFLLTVPHLFMLPEKQISRLRVMVREYGEMDIIMEEGSTAQHVCVLASGTVEVINSKAGIKRAYGHRRISSITAPHIFGLEDVIVERPISFTYHASSAVTLLMISKAQFLSLCKNNPIFANSVGSEVSQTLQVFSVFQDFCRSLFSVAATPASGGPAGLNDGYLLPLSSIINIYKSVDTVFHALSHSPRIDVDALQYCVDRLPQNITQTYIFTLSSVLPLALVKELEDCITQQGAVVRDLHAGCDASASSSPSASFVHSRKRRRCAWRFGDRGQTLIIMRDGFTDVIDFVTTLCMFIVESRKLRSRLQSMVSPFALEILRRALAEEKEGGVGVAERALRYLPFTAAESAALLKIWPDDVISMLHSILLHREDYVVRIDNGLSQRFAEDPLLNWGLSLQRHLRAMMRIGDTSPLPDNLQIDVIFSPNTTVKNLLCSLKTPEARKLVLQHASGTRHGLAAPPSPTNMRVVEDDAEIAGQWSNEEDKYYYFQSRLQEENAEFRAQCRTSLRNSGFVLLEDIFASALLVDLIDVDALDPAKVDAALHDSLAAAQRGGVTGRTMPVADAVGGTAETPTRGGQGASPVRHFIINVDKSFGAQVEYFLRLLILTFGHHIRSVNLVGKSGGLTGNRGDVIVPERLLFAKKVFGEDSADEIRPCHISAEIQEGLRQLLPEQTCIHRGTCMTIPGFVLQNESILKFYRAIYGCTNLDMQSSYIARQLEESKRIGLIPSAIKSRYVFYADNMPLGNEDGSDVLPQTREIISTIYGTARYVLGAVLRGRA